MALLRDALRGLISTWYGPGGRSQLVYEGPSVSEVLGMSVEQLYRSQPYLRLVVEFRARNIALLGLHTYRRVSDTDRVRVGAEESPLAGVLARPNADTTTYELLAQLVSDLSLYDVALWHVVRDEDAPSGWSIRSIPPSWVLRTRGGTAFAPDFADVAFPGKREPTPVPASELLIFHGYNPGLPATGTSPVEALKGILAEQIHANAYRQQVWMRGGRVGTVLTRPKDAPSWSDGARERFARDWKSKWTSDDGPAAGGTPILEEGMELKRIGFSAQEDEYLGVAKLSLSTVASVYHIAPVMVGAVEGTYSNVREYRRALYGPSLGPDLSMVQDRVNTFLGPMIGADPDEYVEFPVDVQLRATPEERYQAMSSAVGAPWMTRDEARALDNRPAIDGGDALVVPLNVLVGGQASPRDSGSQNEVADPVRDEAAGPGVLVKSPRPPDGYRIRAAGVLEDFFKRQRAVVLSRIGAKAGAAPEWWDEARWDRELAEDLFRLAGTFSAELGKAQAAELGFDPEVYDVGRTLAFLKAVAESRAHMINATTWAQLEEVLAAEGDPAGVFDVAEKQRSLAAGAALTTAIATFALVEAGKQIAPEVATKTWRVTSKNPRSAHAAMNGETVPVGAKFSNGADWPGDPVLGADGVAGCLCAVDINLPDPS